MSSPNDNTSPHARAYYDDHIARRRQLSSGPLGGLNEHRYDLRHMLKTTLIIAICLPLLSCQRHSEQGSLGKHSVPNPNQAPPADSTTKVDSVRTPNHHSGKFSTRNAQIYDAGTESGTAAELYWLSEFVDSIDLSSSIAAVDDSTIIYKQFRSRPPEPGDSVGMLYGYATNYVLWSNGRINYLVSFLPRFNDGFSSPEYFVPYIVYWGLSPDSGFSRIYAVRFNLKSHSVDSLFIYNEDLGTDYSDYFAAPLIQNNRYLFRQDQRRWYVDRDFRKVNTQ